MKLEDCSKEELIHYIRTECFHSSDDLEFCVLMFRMQKAAAQGNEEGRKANDALGEYISVIKPFEGKPIRDIPDAVFKISTEAMRRYEKHSEKSNHLHEKYELAQKKIDQNLKGRKGKQSNENAE